MQGAYNRFNPSDEYKFQGYDEIINQQKGESVVSEKNKGLVEQKRGTSENLQSMSYAF